MEYISIENKDLVNGKASFSTDVFADIAAVALKKTKGVIPAKKDAVTIGYKDKQLSITVAVKMLLGADVVKVCETLQNRIHDNFMEMTGVDCQDISLDVLGFYTKDKSEK